MRSGSRRQPERVRSGSRRQPGSHVVVTDAQDIPGLAGIRCLGRSGYTVTGVAPTRRAMGLLSRRCADRVLLPDPAEGMDAFVEQLAALLDSHPAAALIPGRDGSLFTLSANRSSLGEGAAAGLPSHEVIERVFDRTQLDAVATEAGIPAPEQQACGDAEAAASAAVELGWPVLVKPVAVCSERAGRVERHASRSAGDPEEVRAFASELGKCLVQRWVGGSVISVGGVACPDGLLGVVVSRYLRTWPREAGQSSLIVTIDPPAGLVERVEAMISGLGWTGIFELELIEGTDGVIRAIDFNPRLYGSLALARAAGAPLTSMWCDWLLGKRRQPFLSARPGVYFREDTRELYNLADRLRTRRYREAGEILRPRRGTAHAALSLRDPLPGALAVAYATSDILRSRRALAS